MPVSYSLLFAEQEPHVIGVDMARACIELPKGDQEQIAEKRKCMNFREVASLAFSFRELVRIENLRGFDSLVKLKLDCNNIKTIENLGHLTKLTWLDLSFNQIQKIEGLESLVNLTDLSLQDNTITDLEGLGSLRKLQCLSVGNNHLSKLDRMIYLRQFENLELVNLAGNPLCREANYRAYMLSHIKRLKFLDYVRVNPDEIGAAFEHYQDELLEIREREEAQEEEAKAAEKAVTVAELMQEANLEGVDTLWDDMTAGDEDWVKLGQVPSLLDGWNEARDKFIVDKDNFKAQALEKFQTKKSEFELWRKTVDQVCADADSNARSKLEVFEKLKKHSVRDIRLDQQLAVRKVPEALELLKELRRELLAKEMHMFEVLNELLRSFDRNYSELVEQNKQMIMQFFTNTRDLEGTFNSTLVQLGQKLYEEKYNVEGADELESLAEDARILMSDKDMLMNAIQSSHDAHTSKLDAVEDSLVNRETQRASDLVTKHAEWAHKRNRDRIIEIITYVERNSQELEMLLNTEEDDEA
eukprot:jgi/Ulvmu1/5025/UM021_0042.1